MKLIFILLLAFIQLASATSTIRVATFDSGFGGYFTTKEIETVARDLEGKYDVSFQIEHLGDTRNAPYGSRTPEDIAGLSAKGIATAFDRGAEYVFIACNTASTQYLGITKLLEKSHPSKSGKFISIIDSSVKELRRKIDGELKTQETVTVAILATPATIKSGAYVRALAESYGVTPPHYDVKFTSQKRWLLPQGPEVSSASGELLLSLPGKKSIRVILLGPANWVDLIENGASSTEKTKIIARDLKLLTGKHRWNIVGEFCTHFPAIESLIKTEAGSMGIVDRETSFIAQGPLMAETFRSLILPKLPKGRNKISAPQARARIFISGENVEATRTLAREVFPQDPVPEVSILNF